MNSGATIREVLSIIMESTNTMLAPFINVPRGHNIWLNDKVTYTPEISTLTQGEPVEATVTAVGTEGMITITFNDGSSEHVESRLCNAK